MDADAILTLLLSPFIINSFLMFKFLTAYPSDKTKSGFTFRPSTALLSTSLLLQAIPLSSIVLLSTKDIL